MLLRYGIVCFMPISGLVMGYYSGKGIPFFGTTIPGAAKPDGAIAKSAYEVSQSWSCLGWVEGGKEGGGGRKGGVRV
jgi:cytochrome b561